MLYLLVSAILGYILFKEVRMRWNYDIHKIPAPPKLPFLGHALTLRKDNKPYSINVWVRDWRKKLGFPKVMKLCVFGKTAIIVTDINLARNIVLAKSPEHPRDGTTLGPFHRLLMGDDPTPCMFTTLENTPYVQAIRRCYLASFTLEGMKKIFEKRMEVLPKGKLYLEERLNQGTIDLQDFFARLTLDVTGKAQLDMDLGGLDNSSPLLKLVTQCGHDTTLLGTVPFLELGMKMFPNSKFFRAINKDFKDLESQWVKLTQEVCKRGEPDDEDLSYAANIKRVCMPGTKDPLPFNLLKGEIASGIVSGFDTTTHQLGWIFALLATHPDVVEKLLDELRTHGLYGNNARELEFEDLGELKYLAAVIKEGMRMIHALLFVALRIASQDLVLDGYRIPKGSSLLVSSNLSMNCELEWEDHAAFKPERWLKGNIVFREKYYLPFGFGDRDCVGMKFALQSMKVTIVYFITRFSFELVGESIESLVQNGVPGVVFEAKNGINMKVTPRVET